MMPFRAKAVSDWPVAEIDIGGGILRAGCLLIAKLPAPVGPPETYTTIQLMGYGADGRFWALEFGCTGHKSFDSMARTWRWDKQYRWLEDYEGVTGAGS